ncbi:MAG: hypothetical protein M3Z32_02830 [Acidobacteriota bacterium]|nr:hypothetical protein [Acidobacteriota bacterium]
MTLRFRVLFAVLIAGVAQSHPMGNFSVNHYARIQVNARAVDITYVLDLAELPTFDLLRQWGLERTSPAGDLNRKAAEQARTWAGNLVITSNGEAVKPKFIKADLVLADGAGDLPIARITSHLRLDGAAGKLEYEDRNFAERAGWKEIVIGAAPSVTLDRASQGSQDRSSALTQYPQDPTVAPPQDLRAALEWTADAPVVVTQRRPAAAVVAPIEQPKAAPIPAAPATSTPSAAPAGTVVRGDYLSRLLHQRELTMSMILIAVLVAFVLGAAHALTPGHGKTIVAAYLVGSRGTLKHAAFLGAIVTFTHTISVFLLGLATLFLFQYVMPEKIVQVLGAVSGLSIVAIGAWMMYKRIRGLQPKPAPVHSHSHDHEHHHHRHEHVHHGHAHQHPHTHDHEHADHHHSHGHDHFHDHDHSHDHDDEHSHAHVHSHGDLVHSHGSLVHSHGPGGHVHTHAVPDAISWGRLIVLGASGGLVPCESALVLLLSAIALGRVGLGLLLLVAFSVGLAIVLIGIGVLVLYAKKLIPANKSAERHPAFRWIPVASAAIVVGVGLVMTGVSLGWLQPRWMI